MMRRKSQLSSADEFVRNSAFIRREFIGRNDSVEFRRADETNRIVYVFDSDIIKTKCAPWITGPVSDNGGNGYGEIFPRVKSETDHQHKTVNKDSGGEDNRAEIVASILADFALKQHRTLNNLAPIFQFPDHSRETDNVYRAVRRKIEIHENISSRRSKHRRDFELSRTVALIRSIKENGGEGISLDHAITHIIDLIMYQSGSRTERSLRLKEWDNYFGLESEFGGIYDLAKAPHFLENSADIATAFDVLDENKRDSDEQILYSRLYIHWHRKLQKSKGYATDNIPADAHALTQLFLVNSRLDLKKTRVLFVTGDIHITRAAYGGVPVHLVPEKHQSLAETFSISHVRHLWAFTSDALIDKERKDKFVDIFGGLLAEWSNDLMIQPFALENIIRRPRIDSSISTKDIENVLIKWDELTHSSIRQYSAEKYKDISRIRHAIANRVQKALVQENWDELVDMLREDVDRIRDRTVLAMSDLGIDAIIKAHKVGRRNPPELIFDTLKNTNAIFRNLARVNGYLDVNMFEKDFENIKLDCHEERDDGDDRQLSHLKFLVLGAAFASADKWMIAYSHARRAISIIERSRKIHSIIPVRPAQASEETDTHMSGREAYFLAAVSQRILAGRDIDFDKSEYFLNKAENALREDHDHKTAKRLDGRRYQNERLALLLSRYYLTRSDNENDYCDVLVSKINKYANKAIETFLDSESSDGKPLLGGVTKVSLATNIIQTFVIGDFRKFNKIHTHPPCSLSVEDIRSAIDYLQRTTSWKKPSNTTDDVVGATKLICIYADLGELYIAEYDGNQHIDTSSILRQLDDTNQGNVTRYDGWRFKALAKYIKIRFEVLGVET